MVRSWVSIAWFVEVSSVVMNLLRVDMGSGRVSRSEIPRDWELLGGRGVVAWILHREVAKEVEALGSANKLVVAAGLLAGSLVCGANRISVGARSPLTGTIKESNAGGVLGFMLGRVGLRAIVVENSAPDGRQYVLYVDRNGGSLVDAPELAGLGIYERARLLRSRFGERCGFVVVGPAGEQLLPAAALAVSDPEGRPSRFSARGGLGAVAASKGLLAIVVDPVGSGKGLGPGGDRLGEVARRLARLVVENPLTGEIYPKYGTASVVDITNGLGGLPTCNFSRGTFPLAENINADALRRTILRRGGQGDPSHACMPGCIVRCSNVYPDFRGVELVSPLEYETIGMLGSNCGIGDLDAIAQLNRCCNDLGLDTIEVGATLGVLMEGKVLRFGDHVAALRLLEEVRAGTLTGKLIGAGVVVAGKSVGVRRIPAVKGQAMAAYEPRAIKGLGVTYGTSPMGADHTAGNTIRLRIKHHAKEGQLEASSRAQRNAALFDNLGVCLFVAAATATCRDLWAEAVSAVVGRRVQLEELEETARDVLRMEREFNGLCGVETDRLPGWCYEEANPDTGTTFDIEPSELASVWSDLGAC